MTIYLPPYEEGHVLRTTRSVLGETVCSPWRLANAVIADMMSDVYLAPRSYADRRFNHEVWFRGSKPWLCVEYLQSGNHGVFVNPELVESLLVCRLCQFLMVNGHPVQGDDTTLSAALALGFVEGTIHQYLPHTRDMYFRLMERHEKSDLRSFYTKRIRYRVRHNGWPAETCGMK